MLLFHKNTKLFIFNNKNYLSKYNNYNNIIIINEIYCTRDKKSIIHILEYTHRTMYSLSFI